MIKTGSRVRVTGNGEGTVIAFHEASALFHVVLDGHRYDSPAWDGLDPWHLFFAEELELIP
ncbi:MAG: hypothetical protein ACTHJM_15850 [Marmoricola sp.]